MAVREVYIAERYAEVCAEYFHELICIYRDIEPVRGCREVGQKLVHVGRQQSRNYRVEVEREAIRRYPRRSRERANRICEVCGVRIKAEVNLLAVEVVEFEYYIAALVVVPSGQIESYSIGLIGVAYHHISAELYVVCVEVCREVGFEPCKLAYAEPACIRAVEGYFSLVELCVCKLFNILDYISDVQRVFGIGTGNLPVSALRRERESYCGEKSGQSAAVCAVYALFIDERTRTEVDARIDAEHIEEGVYVYARLDACVIGIEFADERGNIRRERLVYHRNEAVGRQIEAAARIGDERAYTLRHFGYVADEHYVDGLAFEFFEGKYCRAVAAACGIVVVPYRRERGYGRTLIVVGNAEVGTDRQPLDIAVCVEVDFKTFEPRDADRRGISVERERELYKVGGK